MPNITEWMGTDPHSLRRYLQEGSDTHLDLRRGIVQVSLIDIAAMAATTTTANGDYQAITRSPTRAVRHQEAEFFGRSLQLWRSGQSDRYRDVQYEHGARFDRRVRARATSCLASHPGYLGRQHTGSRSGEVFVLNYAKSRQGLVSLLHRRRAHAFRDSGIHFARGPRRRAEPEAAACSSRTWPSVVQG